MTEVMLPLYKRDEFFDDDSRVWQDLGALSIDVVQPDLPDDKSLSSKKSLTQISQKGHEIPKQIILQALSVPPSDIKTLSAEGDIAAAPAPIINLIKALGGQKLLTEKGKFKTGESGKPSQAFRKKVMRRLEAMQDPNYVQKLQKAVKRKFGEGQTIIMANANSKATDPQSVPWQQAMFGGGRAKFFKVGKIPNPQGLKMLSRVGFGQGLKQELTYNKNEKYAPVPLSVSQKSAKKTRQMESYINGLNNGRLSRDDPFWSSIDPSLVKWNNQFWQILDPQLDKKYSSFVTSGDRANWNLNASLVLMNKKLTDQQMQSSVPALVREIVAANAVYSSTGIGPISKTSLPFYAGRWLDSATGRVRVLPTPTTKFINPLSYYSRVQYLQARIVNSWNKFVGASDQYYSLLAKKRQQWQKKQQAKLKSQLQGNQKNMMMAAKWMQGQIKSYQLGIPISNSSRIVLGTSQEVNKFKQIKTAVNTLYALGDKVAKADYEKFSKSLQTIAQAVIAKVTGQTAQDTQRKLKIARAYGTWMQKGLQKNADAIKKLVRSTIPEQLDPTEIEKLEQKMIEWNDVFSKTNITMTPANIDKYLQMKPAQTLDAYLTNLGNMKKQVSASGVQFGKQFTMPKKDKAIKKADKLWEKVGKQGLKINDI